MEFSRQEYWSGLPFPSPFLSINHIYDFESLVTTWCFCFDQAFIERIESRNGVHTIEAAADLGYGVREYELVEVK